MESEYQKLLQRRIKSAQSLQRKIELERSMDDITKTISKLKTQLKSVS